MDFRGRFVQKEGGISSWGKPYKSIDIFRLYFNAVFLEQIYRVIRIFI